MKSQIALEYLYLAIMVIASIAVLANYSYLLISESSNQHYLVYAANMIKDAVSEVGFMGYPARKTVDIYIPPNVDESRTYLANNSANFGLISSTGTSDIFFISDYCLIGHLPYDEGYYPLKIVPSKDCVVIDYNDISANPSPIEMILYYGTNASLDLILYNLMFDDIEANLTSSVNLLDFADLDNETLGKQLIKELGFFNASEQIIVPIVFFGHQLGIYEGFFQINETIIPVKITVIDVVGPIINYTNPSSAIVYLYENACINAIVTPGTHPIDSVWAELKIPTSCWASGGVCDAACSYSSLISNDYYNDPGCSGSCPSSGQFFTFSGTCNPDGSGNCYKPGLSGNYNATCTQGLACNASCSGTPIPCITCPNCTFCGCDFTAGGPVTKWTEDFSSNSDWATWSSTGNGIAYVNTAANCINDANDDCMNLDGGGTYYIYKQSSIDLSDCELGSASFGISHVKESGNLEGNDCVYAAFSNNGGISWSSNYQIFCNDLPGVIAFNQSIPDSYLTNNFRIRIGNQNFQSVGEMAWLDGFAVHCHKPETCTGTPTNCSIYANSSSCSACGCNWTENAWNWALAGETSGYSNYQTCSWEPLSFAYENISLFESGASCAGSIGDNIYGAYYNMTQLGNYTLIAGYVNDTFGSTDIDVVNINITVKQPCEYNWTINSQILFNEGTYDKTNYNSTFNAVTLFGTNNSGTYVSKIFDAGDIAQWEKIQWHQINRTFINDSNRIMKLDFENSNGTMYYDSTEYMNNASCTAPYCPILSSGGVYGYELAFDGANDYLQAANLMGYNFTLDLWIKTNETSPTGAQCYQGDALVWADLGGVMANDVGLAILNNKLCFFTGNPDTSIVGLTDLNDGQWHHIIASRDATSGIKKLYVDGVLESTGTTNTNLLTANPIMQIGGNTYDGLYFNGSMDTLIIRNQVLDAQQVLSEYNQLFSKLNVSIMGCDDSLCIGETWSQEYTDPFNSTINIPSSNYFRYLFKFYTSDPKILPMLSNATVYYKKACE